MAQTRSYIAPIDSNGVAVTNDAGHGKNTLYFFVLGRTAAAHQSVTITGFTGAMNITSATIQDTDHSEKDYTDFDTTVGVWINEDPSTGFVAVDGTGWTVTNSVVAAAAGGVGGARWNLAQDAATRTRLAVQTGAAGGVVSVSTGSKAP